MSVEDILKKRTNRQNGSYFWGCSNFPKCKETRNYDSIIGMTGRTSEEEKRIDNEWEMFIEGDKDFQEE